MNNGTINVNDTLAVFVEDEQLAIGRDDGGLVNVELREVRHLVDALVSLAAEQASDRELVDLARAAVTSHDDVQAENLRLRGEIENMYGWIQALQTELIEWRQAAEEAQDAQVGVSIPVVGELSGETTPADFARFREMVGDADSK